MTPFSIACDCGNEVCGCNEEGVIGDDGKQWLEDIGWRYIDGKPSCPKCNGTEGQWMARLTPVDPTEDFED